MSYLGHSSGLKMTNALLWSVQHIWHMSLQVELQQGLERTLHHQLPLCESFARMMCRWMGLLLPFIFSDYIFSIPSISRSHPPWRHHHCTPPASHQPCHPLTIAHPRPPQRAGPLPPSLPPFWPPPPLNPPSKNKQSFRCGLYSSRYLGFRKSLGKAKKTLHWKGFGAKTRFYGETLFWRSGCGVEERPYFCG